MGEVRGHSSTLIDRDGREVFSEFAALAAGLACARLALSGAWERVAREIGSPAKEGASSAVCVPGAGGWGVARGTRAGGGAVAVEPSQTS